MSEFTEERWRKISSMLDSALSVDPSGRAGWLEREISDPDLRFEVAELLANAERSDGILDRPAGQHLEASLRENEFLTGCGEDESGLRIGPYRIVREVGRGGMGVVYEAERADGQFENRVALKLVKPGFDGREIVRRFERERRILARLEHPAIARILDGGVSEDGRPYFAMEFVDGEPLTAYCDRQALPIEDRLRLFARVCEAVQYAHGRLIVHRDLKPSNILVTPAGELKLVDFGIAKVLAEEEDGADLTRSSGERPFTPAFAAPEQLAGEAVTTATDVYTLGLVLYELIVGRRPFESETGSSRDLERAILETDPLAPSRAAANTAQGPTAKPSDTAAGRAAARGVSARGLVRRLEGDLDAIVLTALRKEPARRYGSAQALREDLESHLAHKAIRARRDSAARRAAKFVRRHRVGATAAALLLLSIAAGFLATAWQARQKTLEAAKARQISEFVTGLFEAADPSQARGQEITARELVEQGATRLERELEGQPELQAEMGLVLGRINDKLGLSEEALVLLDRSLERLPASPGSGNPASRRTRANALRSKGAALVHLGRSAEAEPLLREAEAEHRKLPARGFDRDLEIAEDLDELTIALQSLGRLNESEAAVQATFDLRLPVVGPNAPEIASSYNNLAVIQRQLGKLDEAEANYDKALAIRIPVLGREHPETADTLNNLAALLLNRGRYGEAAAAFEEVSAIYSRLYGENHSRTVTGANNLAVTVMKLGEFDRAEALFESVLAYWRETASEQHPNALVTRSNIGLLYQLRGETGRAKDVAEAVVEGAKSVVGAEHPVTAVLTLRLASASRELGDSSGAKALAVPALAILENGYGPEHPHVAAALEELGRIEAELGESEPAEEHLRRAVAVRTAQGGAQAFETLAARTVLAAALRDQDDLIEAEQILVPDLAIGRRVLPANHPVLVDLLRELGQTLGAAGRAGEAEPLLDEAVKLATERYSADNWHTALAELRLAELLTSEGRASEARAVARKAEKTMTKSLGADHPLSRAARGLS